MPTDILNVPVIGISGGNASSASVQAMMQQIANTGAVPLLLSNHTKRDARADIGKIDALVVMGNDADIDPSRYGAAAHPKTVSELATPEGRARAQYEESLLAQAVNTRMPVLGICAGMQRLNVLCGGSLHQHVPDLVGHDEHTQKNYDIGMSIPVQPVMIGKDTKLAEIAQEISTVYTPGHAPVPPSVILENSMHHQAVNIVGEGLRPTAFAADTVKLPDGRNSYLIEAIEADPKGAYANQFLMGVQWHPEFGASPLGERIAQHVARAGQEYAVANQRSHSQSEVRAENQLSAMPKDTLPPRHGSMVEMILRQRAMSSQSAGVAV